MCFGSRKFTQSSPSHRFFMLFSQHPSVLVSAGWWAFLAVKGGFQAVIDAVTPRRFPSSPRRNPSVSTSETIGFSRGNHCFLAWKTMDSAEQTGGFLQITDG